MSNSDAGAGARTDAEEIKAAPQLKEKLRKLGLLSTRDLLLHLPLRYEDETRLSTLKTAVVGSSVQIQGRLLEVSLHSSGRRQLLCRLQEEHDQSSELTLRFLNFYGSQSKELNAACTNKSLLRVFGEIRDGFFGVEMVHPRYRVVSAETPLAPSLTPVYPSTAGVSQNALRKLIQPALKTADLSEVIAPDYYQRHGLLSFADALNQLHAPIAHTTQTAHTTLSALEERTHPAWQRIKFDELLAQQLSLRRAYLARRQIGAPILGMTSRLSQQLVSALPFALTAAQQRVSQEIAHDLAQPYPMQRLLQGDVGSGKTIVAALAACQAIESGYQAALMAPTEILAEQHYQKLDACLRPLGVSLSYLSGSLKKSLKSSMQAHTAGDAQLVIGTHALIQSSVDFARLGLVIIDEQHRFGVAQRLELRRKGGNPHQLMMSATPIPRTLAMSYYADLDVSLLDELPPGRTPISTRVISDLRRQEVINRLRVAVGHGRQAYWVCPLIEESEKLQLQTAIDTHAALSAELSSLRIGLVHGRLKAQEKAETMAAFAAGEIDVLVATTVIEVGVDVANASLMVIEHAERFGLSQLHQLRGRVGRGKHDSACVLLYQQPLSRLARARLNIIFAHTDGFEIARQDLNLRGPGEFIGSRQSGVPLLRYADLEQDAALLEPARELAERLLAEDPDGAERHLKRWLGEREELLKA
ncbi:MAG: ATP-dependent DNA helicase RecG [Pseudomonadota bacterium]